MKQKEKTETEKKQNRKKQERRQQNVNANKIEKAFKDPHMKKYLHCVQYPREEKWLSGQ